MVTGAAGYLGSILSEHLLEAGYEVTGLDNLSLGQSGPFHLAARIGFEFVRGDARDEALMRRLLPDADVIVPLAAIVGAPAVRPRPGRRPVREPRGDPSPEPAAEPGPTSGLSDDQQRVRHEVGGRVLHRGHAAGTDLPVRSDQGRRREGALLGSENAITLRLATVFGMSPRMRLDLLVNHFVYAAVTDGYLVIFEKHFKRNYIHIRDVADCFVHCIRNADRMIGKAYNVGLESANLSKEELASKIQEYVPRFYVHFAEVGSDPDKRNYVVSNERLRQAGFEARRSLDEGIQELLKGYRMMPRSNYRNASSRSSPARRSGSSFLGGGTDYPDHYHHHGGQTLGVAIDKYSCTSPPPGWRPSSTTP